MLLFYFIKRIAKAILFLIIMINALFPALKVKVNSSWRDTKAVKWGGL